MLLVDCQLVTITGVYPLCLINSRKGSLVAAGFKSQDPDSSLKTSLMCEKRDWITTGKPESLMLKQLGGVGGVATHLRCFASNDS